MEQVNVSWADFSSSVPKLFNRHKIEERYTDVTLVSDDNQMFRAHKLVLSAGSQYFDKILEENMIHPYPMLCLDGINSSDLNYVLDYIYNGEIKVPEADLQKFLKVATRLKCLGLNVSKQEVKVKTIAKDQPIETDNNTISSAEITHPVIFKEQERLSHIIIEDIKREKSGGNSDLNDSKEGVKVKTIVKDQPIEPTENKVSSAELTYPGVNIFNNQAGLNYVFLEPGEPGEIKDKVYIPGNQLIKLPIKPDKNMFLKVCKIEGEMFSMIELKKKLEQLYQKGPTNLYHCLKCSKRRDKRSHMEDHVQSHINELEFQCYDCNKKFHTLGGRRRHMQLNCTSSLKRKV